jgi:hypothetical protein
LKGDIMSEESKHTPGPWVIGEKEDTDLINIYDGNNQSVLLVDVLDRPVGSGNANARLIAAAPALLAACKRFQQYVKASKTGTVDPEVAHDYWESIVDDIESAIAEAEKEL